jgi:hypothetical protein
MFDRTRAYDFRASYRSRYEVMIESNDPESKANAEACKLASQAWEQIAQFAQRPELEDEEGNPLEFDVESVIEDMKTKWNEYCRTGVAVDEVDTLVRETQARIARGVLSPVKTQDSHLETIRENLRSQDPQTADPKAKKGQKSPQVDKATSTVAVIANGGKYGSPIDVIDERNREYIQVSAIDVVIAEIEQELGVERQEHEIVSAFDGAWPNLGTQL